MEHFFYIALLSLGCSVVGGLVWLWCNTPAYKRWPRKDQPERTDWFPPEIKPVCVGWYARRFILGNDVEHWPQYWDGEHWRYGDHWPEPGGVVSCPVEWRGLAKNPEAV